MKALSRLFSFLLVLALLTACAAPAPAAAVEATLTPADQPAPTDQATPTPLLLPDGETWLKHFREDLLPYWDTPAALGEPVGNFPSERCDDGSAYSPANPCSEIADNGWLAQDVEYVVSRSRQTYGYGVAFHLTGDPRYLEYMKAGVDYLRANAFDRSNGGTYSLYNGDTGAWEPAAPYRNPQELAYSLLGITFYYYLTRDAEVLPDILAVKDFIFDNYYNEDLNALQWNLESDGNANPLDKRIVAQLDNLNGFMVLLTPLLPEPEQSAWKADMQKLANILIDEFYSAEENLFFLTVNDPSQKSTQNAATDFGHTIKAMWMIRFVGILTVDQALIDFAEKNGPRVLEQAYIAENGSWANGVAQGGQRVDDKDWWVYNELDQFAMTLALSDPALRDYLPQTSDYFFRVFVDHEYGEIWTLIDADTDQPAEGSLPKSWPWKSAYHSFEHALVGYITAQQFYGQPVTLYYAFKEQPAYESIHPYYFEGVLEDMQVTVEDGAEIYIVQFTGLH